MESDRTSATPTDGISNSLQRVRPLHGRTSGPTRRSTKGQWTPEEDEILRKAVQRFKGKNWKKIAECFKDRTDVQCLHRWQKVLNPELVKGPWSKEEDEIIIDLVNKYGPKKWSTIAQHLPGRIGKQCRERWHNHLNPSINKEAWTQEEELALIRAHQIYGNKWAELTKFLPGRTDNAIKNHWNSSVKKKLDSYLASGLLSQFPALPNVNSANQILPTTSSKFQQSSEDRSVCREGKEVDEVSECSQGSALVGCSQSTSDRGNTFVHTREERGVKDESSHEQDPSLSSATCSKNFNAFHEVACSMPEIPNDLNDTSQFVEQTIAHEIGASITRDGHLNPDDIPNMSALDLMQVQAGFFMQFLNSCDSHGVPPLQTAMDLGTISHMGSIAVDSDNQDDMFNLEDGHCGIIYTGPENHQCFPSGNGIRGVEESSDSVILQPSNYQIPEAGMLAPQSCNTISSDNSGPSSYQAFSLPIMFGVDSDQLIENPRQEIITCGDFVYASEPGSSTCGNGMDGQGVSTCNGMDGQGLKDQMDQYIQENECVKLVPVNDFGPVQPASVQTCSVNEQNIVKDEKRDPGTLCYEPPRFPSLDVPFFSCDLIQSGTDMQQEYSPLGIRQLMMSSMNCLTPFRLWDSPSRDSSPDAVLKSAAKTFTCTPSILKKRHRDLVSPLSEKRSEKKLESDIKHEFSDLARNFSRLEVMVDDAGNEKATRSSPLPNQEFISEASIEDKENLNPEFEGTTKEGMEGTRFSGRRDLGRESNNGDADDAIHVKRTVGVLVERGKDDPLFFSPDRFGSKSDRAVTQTTKALGNSCLNRLETAPNQGTVSSSSEAPCLSVCSPRICAIKEGNNLVVATSVQSVPASENAGEGSGNGVGLDNNISIFGETPFKRSIESPSAWKSPWFINSFLSSPRVDTEITLEDFGFLFSPGDRSYDAIGLMKQLSEQTAATFADAQEVLGGETPESILRGRCSKNQKADENTSQFTSNVLTERRMLDFSECGTPGKKAESGKFPGGSSSSISSPSSYLLKECR
ncbi:transcription factor MYB3R-1 [Ipomoea triloba]|uniref:transcription factor MYB3R-1 n=1 Tax=Ipomoea triloba TaxID=35885 RepID=UPI00125E40AF|nr:transcription factor MYB3R-1 [Ipomoea triloba]XP_031120069.1 transcription factor MYB3R-1 [Ipomoea triloba]